MALDVGSIVANLGFNLDRSGLNDFQRARAQAEAVSKKAITQNIRVDYDGDGMRKWLAASRDSQGAAGTISKAMESVGGAMRGASAATDSFSTASTGLRANMGPLAGSLTAVGGGIAALIPVMVAASGTAVALGGSLTAAAGGAGALGAALAGAALPLGGIALFAQSRMKLIAEAFKATEKAQDGSAKTAKTSADAQRAASDRVTSALESQKAATERVADSKRSLADAQRQAVFAQENLTAARARAVRELNDMRIAADAADLSQRRASLSLREAQRNLSRVQRDPEASSLDVESAALSVDEARQSLRRARAERGRTGADNTRAQAGGVAASPDVVGAQRSLADANRRVADSQRGIAAAMVGVAAANRDVARAQSATADAVERTSAAASAAEIALGKLTASERRLLGAVQATSKAITDLLQPVSDAIADSLARALTRLAPGLERFKGAFALLGRDIAGLIDSAAESLGGPEWSRAFVVFLDGAHRLVLDFGRIFGTIADIVRDVAVAAMPALKRGVDDVADALSDFGEKAREPGKLQGVVDTLIGHFKSWMTLIYQVGRILYEVFNGGAEQGGKLVDRLADAAKRFADFLGTDKGRAEMHEFFQNSIEFTVRLVEALATLVGGVLKVSEAFIELVNKLDPFFRVMRILYNFMTGDLREAFRLAREAMGLTGEKWERLSDQISDAVDNIKDAVRGVGSAIVSTITRAGPAVWDAVTDLGKLIVRGIVKGVKGLPGALKDAITGGLSGALSDVGGFLKGAFKGDEPNSDPTGIGFGSSGAFGIGAIPRGLGDTAGLAPAAAAGLSAVSAMTGGGISVSSGVRTPAENEAAGGAARSDHLTGNAIDLVPKGGWSAAGTAMLDRVAAWAKRNPAIRWIGWRGVPNHGPGNHLHLSFWPKGGVAKGDPAGAYSIGALRQIAARAGFPDPNVAAAVAYAESGGNPVAHNPVPPDDSYGLWQINVRPEANPKYRGWNLTNPMVNARAAMEISGGGRNWRPWSTFTSGAYKQYLTPGGIQLAGVGPAAMTAPAFSGPASTVDATAIADRAAQRIINPIVRATAPARAALKDQASGFSSMLGGLSHHLGLVERRNARTEEDLSTDEGRGQRVDELEGVASIKQKILAAREKQIMVKQKVIATYRKDIKELRKELKTATKGMKPRILAKIKLWQGKIAILKGEIGELGKLIPDAVEDVNDAAAAIGEASKGPSALDKWAQVTSSVDAQVRAGLLTDEQGTAYKRAAGADVIAGKVGALTDMERLQVMGDVRELEQGGGAMGVWQKINASLDAQLRAGDISAETANAYRQQAGADLLGGTMGPLSDNDRLSLRGDLRDSTLEAQRAIDEAAKWAAEEPLRNMEALNANYSRVGQAIEMVNLRVAAGQLTSQQGRQQRAEIRRAAGGGGYGNLGTENDLRNAADALADRANSLEDFVDPSVMAQLEGLDLAASEAELTPDRNDDEQVRGMFEQVWRGIVATLKGAGAPSALIAQANRTLKSFTRSDAYNSASDTLAQVQAKLTSSQNNLRLSQANFSTLTSSGDIGVGGSNALRAVLNEAGAVGGQTIINNINTLHPGDPRTLAAISGAATQGYYAQGIPGNAPQKLLI